MDDDTMKVIKGVHDARRYLEDREWVDKSVGVHIDALNDALALLKEQEERLRKFQKDKDKLCLEVSEWKHKFHDRPEQDKENGHWIVLEYCANEGIYCSKCMNKIFDRSIKPKKKLSNYCPNCGSKNTHFFNPSTDKIMYSD